MKRTHTVCKMMTLALLLPAFEIQANELESALKAALEETPIGQVDLGQRRFELFKHRFDVEPVQVVEKQKSRYVLAGKLIRFQQAPGSNDEIGYRIIREKGVIKEITWQVNRGEWQPLSDSMTRALGDYRKGGPMPEEKQSEVREALKQAVDGSWQKAAEYFMAHIAIRHC